MAAFPVIDAWANPAQPIDAIPEVARLFKQSGADPFVLSRRLKPVEVVKLMDEAGVSQICLCAWYRPGKAIFSNEDVAEFTRAYPNRFIGIAGVDLLSPVEAVRELRKYVKEEGFKALRVVPWLWNLPPNDKHYWPLFVECIESDIPFMTQVGHTGPLCPSEVGRPVPRNLMANINVFGMLNEMLDSVYRRNCIEVSIPSHCLWTYRDRLTKYPWTQEMISVAWKHENVYIDTSAHLPKYYPPELIHFANTTGKKKVMFGSNFPQLNWKDCLRQAHELELRNEVKQDFFGGNIKRVLKLNTDGKRKEKL